VEEKKGFCVRRIQYSFLNCKGKISEVFFCGF